jgi:hypothetical protein
MTRGRKTRVVLFERLHQARPVSVSAGSARKTVQFSGRQTTGSVVTA